MSVKSTLLEDAIEMSGFVFVLTSAVQKSKTSEEICINMVRGMSFLFVLESSRGEKLDEDTIRVFKIAPCW